MGSAFTALADDASASFYNPAGLGQLIEKEMGLSYASLYPGLKYPTNRADMGNGFMGYLHPFGKEVGTLGISWINRHVSDLYSENSYVVSYGRKLIDGVYFGANFKVLQLSYSKSRWGYELKYTPGPYYDWAEGVEVPFLPMGLQPWVCRWMSDFLLISVTNGALDCA